jgi:hypothetical protein
MERGVRGIFLGFDTNQKGYVFYSPGTRQIYISKDVVFDESFDTVIATTWQSQQDSLALRPVKSTIPTVDATLEHTGSIEDCPTITEEGNITTANITAAHKADDDDDGDLPDLLHPDDDSFVSTSEHEPDEELDMDDDILDLATGNINPNDDTDIITPQPLSTSLCRST